MARAAVQALALVALAACVGPTDAASRRLPRLYSGPILFVSGALVRMNGDGSDRRALSGEQSAQARLSPDGRLIAFGCANSTVICVMDPNGRALRQLTPPIADSRASEPAWAPDSRTIVFSRYGVAQGLYTVDLGERIRRLTSGPDRNAVWSPDDRRIAFTRTRQTYDDRLQVLNADGTQDRALGRGSLPRWSPDGRWFSFIGPNHYGLFKVSRLGSRPVPLVRNVTIDSYNWSPDGHMLVFAAAGHVAVCCGATRIGLVPSTGKGPKWLTRARGGTDSVVTYQDSPTWSPSGKRLAFVSVSVDYGVSKSDPDVTTEIWSMDADGRHRRQLTPLRHQWQLQDHQFLTWAPSSTNEQHERAFYSD